MREPRIRALTDAEKHLAREVFGGAINLERVRVLRAPWPLIRAFVPGRWFKREWISWPASYYYPDFTHAHLGVQAIFIHEMVHVWQAQQGVNLLFAKLKAGDSAESYRYQVSDTCHWGGLNIEQQAMVVEHRFRLSRGLNVPADRAFYDRVCPVHFSTDSGNLV